MGQIKVGNRGGSEERDGRHQQQRRIKTSAGAVIFLDMIAQATEQEGGAQHEQCVGDDCAISAAAPTIETTLGRKMRYTSTRLSARSRSSASATRWTKRPDTIVNNGHTIQLNFAAGNTLHVGERRYGLTQFHFHHPSEHLVDGKKFAMEAHFVHSAEDGGLAVVGVFIVPGEANGVFHKGVSTMPEEEEPAAAADPAIDPNALLPALRTFYHYEGSLTMPPCSQTVDWLGLTHHVEVAEADITRFAKLYPMNARPVQELDRRFILTSSPR